MNEERQKLFLVAVEMRFLARDFTFTSRRERDFDGTDLKKIGLEKNNRHLQLVWFWS
jgi:hypothetical protein